MSNVLRQQLIGIGPIRRIDPGGDRLARRTSTCDVVHLVFSTQIQMTDYERNSAQELSKF